MNSQYFLLGIVVNIHLLVVIVTLFRKFVYIIIRHIIAMIIEKILYRETYVFK